MNFVPQWVARRLGRRGWALLALGLAFILVGVRSIVAPTEIDGSRYLLHLLIPPLIRGALWIVPGVLAIIAACKRGVGQDGFGFVALTMPLILMVFSYSWSVVGFLVGASDWPLGWTSAVIWLSLLVLVLVISGWAEVPSSTAPRHKKRGAHRAT